MSIHVGRALPTEKSFEEQRVDDYIASYRATGRPPPPVPQEPADPKARLSLNLPPLFEPYVYDEWGGYFSVSPDFYLRKPLERRLHDPLELPRGQEFSVTRIDSEAFHSIVMQLEYSYFSFEELRYYAYGLGNKYSPVSIAKSEFKVPETSPKSPGTSVLFGNLSSSTSSLPKSFSLPSLSVSASASSSTKEIMQSQVAQNDFIHHSPEELRVLWMKTGREMTSAQILGTVRPAPVLPTPAPTSTVPSLFSSSTSATTPPTFGRPSSFRFS
ncbi:hypothetical protein FISHEDRAFT_75958 [Fistulina hepatica ATCC 64428]|uniref:Uncharacterized protein n=1 Tax=Fistulina hepatica ATCC 64428 TaxID=1128425 RepID=A0A0D7A6W3_9AGAR|nr:hypothetical protein FISHEDRAFT_75958 [Fistulina hepatica ATCC 64428]